jgi:hypothetical protein
MQNFLPLFVDFMIFWFIDAPKGLIDYFSSLNIALLKYFSFRLLLTTFFKPWKNEYRDGLVGFSLAMGMIVKGMLLFFGSFVLVLFFLFEITFILFFVSWPFLTIAILFI